MNIGSPQDKSASSRWTNVPHLLAFIATAKLFQFAGLPFIIASWLSNPSMTDQEKSDQVALCFLFTYLIAWPSYKFSKRAFELLGDKKPLKMLLSILYGVAALTFTVLTSHSKPSPVTQHPATAATTLTQIQDFTDADLNSGLDKVRSTLPKKIDAYTTLTAVKNSEKVVSFEYQVPREKQSLLESPEFTEALKDQSCQDAFSALLLHHRYSLHISYLSNDAERATLKEITVVPNDCAKYEVNK